MRLTTRILLAATLTTVLTACGSTLSGAPLPGETDISTLDVGSYPTEPLNAHDDDPVPPFYKMYEVAAMRLADFVINSAEIDPAMKYGKRARSVSAGVTPWALGDDGVMSPIAKTHKLLYGFESSGASRDTSVNTLGGWPSKRDDNELTASTMVFQFPTTEQAAAAAQEFHDADLAAQENRNQPVTLPDYPAAKSHWRPDSPFLRTLLPHGPYVIAFLLSVDTPDQQALVTLAQTAYAKQIEALDKTTPLSDKEVMTLPWDPDHLAMRTLNPEELTSPDGSGFYLVTGRHGILHYSGDPLPSDRGYIAEQLTKMDAQQVALSWGSIGIRTPDAETARRAVTEQLFPWQVEADADAPPNLPDSACVENRSLAAPKRFSCILAYNEYVGIVSGNQLLDAQQRAAAQYALFANTR
ncbi:DUF7373 family lipoprotein [Nocardia mangyaensis]|uniref:DUF7373 family lipoprotein n=1 Tax=Nocardia mangyaensis TaxID=2213200 RepID=UPI00267744B7|nr:hypothetical protein [Nocardia mangyaensis]MDO3647245.1 hypothetical protein [Nocardia mangyaensis]